MPEETKAELGIRLMKMIDPKLPKGIGAAILVYDYYATEDEPGELSYICTGERITMREVLRTLLKKWDAEDYGEVN